MTYVFKAFFEKTADAEISYYALRTKNLTTDLVLSTLDVPATQDFSAKIAYALEGNTMLASSEISNNISPTTLLGTNDPRVVMTPILFNKKQTSEKDACFLYGHCRKKDIAAVSHCLKRNGAFSVLSSEISQQSHIIY